MNQLSTKTAQPDLDTQALSDFIYDLNIARRQLSLYPADHPQITKSSNTVLQIFKKLCESSEVIRLGIAPDSLVFGDNWLNLDNPVYRDFARFLSSFNIASISFNADLTSTELIRFNQILCKDRDAMETGSGLSALLKQHEIKNISITPIDYSVFQTATDKNPHGAAGDKQLWEEFLLELQAEQLDMEGEKTHHLGSAHLTDRFNQSVINETNKAINYDQVISQFIARMGNREEQSNSPLGQKFANLIQSLNPEMKRRFLGSTFRAIDHHAENNNSFLQALPREIIAEALEQQNRGQLNLSSRLVNLLGQFSTNNSPWGTTGDRGGSEQLSDEMLLSRVEVLLLEDSHDAYVPSTYQKTLQNILNDRVKGTIPRDKIRGLNLDFEMQSIERQFCDVAFNMLHNEVNHEIEGVIQDNLVELSEFFLDTGDFRSLQEIFIRWSEYLYGGGASARFLDEKVLADQTREVFMNGVLDSIELWGAEKYDEICEYIAEVGEPYAELLIERLGNEEQMNLRKTWMKLLVELGDRGHQLIVQALHDRRWYLVRNLLIVLGRQAATLPLKAINQLTGHPHPNVRREALRIMFRGNPATANRLLLKELSSGNRQTLAAAVPLAELSHDTKILEQLHRIIQAEQFEEDFELRGQVLDALARLGKPESIPILSRLLKKKRLLRSPSRSPTVGNI